MGWGIHSTLCVPCTCKPVRQSYHVLLLTLGLSLANVIFLVNILDWLDWERKQNTHTAEQSLAAPINGPHCSQPRTSLSGKPRESLSFISISQPAQSTCWTLTAHLIPLSFIPFPKHMDWLLFLLLPGVLLVLCESHLMGECQGRIAKRVGLWGLGVLSPTS